MTPTFVPHIHELCFSKPGYIEDAEQKCKHAHTLKFHEPEEIDKQKVRCKKFNLTLTHCSVMGYWNRPAAGIKRATDMKQAPSPTAPLVEGDRLV